MGLIQDKISEWRRRKAEAEDYARGKYIEENFKQKRKGADERELERFNEEDRKATIKRILKQRRKIENDEVWSGRKGNPVFAPNITVGDKNLFGSETIFHGGNMFTNQPSIFKHDDLFIRK